MYGQRYSLWRSWQRYLIPRQCQDDTLDGGTGADTIYTGTGLDTIVTRTGDGGSSITNADVVKDFTDGSDIIGLSGLNYSDLSVKQGSGNYSSHVIVQEKVPGVLVDSRKPKYQAISLV